MKEQLASLIRHALTALAGLGGFLFSKGLIDQGDVTSVDGAGVSLASAIAVILAAVVARLLLTLSAKIFRSGSGELDDGEGGTGTGNTLLLLLCGTAAVLMGGLSSCSAPLPLQIGIAGHGFSGSYSAKGLNIQAVIPTK